MSSSSPSPFATSSFPQSTAASSPPPSEAVSNADVDESSREPSERPYFVEDEDFEQRFARLTRLLEKSSAYASVLKIQMDREKENSALRTALQARVSVEEPKKSRSANRGGKRKRVSEKGLKNEGSSHQITEAKDEQTSTPKFRQPELITGAQLKDYQLEGVEWMVSLDKNGISGILADEMGLGKTLQTIAFNAYLRELRNYKPFLIVCPLSVLHNWIEEFQKFAPDIPVCMYHGAPAEREELRRTVMREPEPEVQSRAIKKDKLDSESPTKSTKRRSSTRKSKAKVVEQTGSVRSRKRVKVGENKDISDTEDDEVHENESVLPEDAVSTPRQTEVTFPVVITTYEMIIRDRIHLGNYKWGYIVVDEGHRLKNLDCKLMKEIKKYSSAGRMILTGTPLHNNLAELWSLLNFILPDIFDDLDSFQEWFSLGKMQMHLSSERSSVLIHTLHGILKPFLLRRLKADVEGLLPPKKEYVLYAPLSVRQRELYDTIVAGGLRSYLINGKDGQVTKSKEKASVDMNAPRKLRGKRKRYDVDGDDEEYFEMLENGELVKKNEDAEEIGRDHQYKATLKQVNNMKLQNAVMQLRKVCSHPFLFDWPLDPVTQQPIMNEELVNLSGKMMVLERLLGELFRRKHKVLLFSQFTTMLDIIEDWATELKEWSICRIDGSTPPLERRAQMNRFQQAGDEPDAPMLFLLSTRAGGLGINLTAADTVIFYDQDWNPQMDVQAQDRAHRIGQKKPVLIFRLVSAHTIETKIMQRATEKRKLEALVIAKGKFKMPGLAAGRSKPATMAEMAASLLRIEGEQIQVVPNTEAGKASVLSDEDLEMLLDRSDAVFADRGKGWTSGGSTDNVEGESHVKTGKRAAFAVYDAPAEQGNDALATLMGEDIEH